MAFVVCEPCLDCRYTDCVVVCPCECFYLGDRMLFIDPNDCIDCAACAGECPVEAIHQDVHVPAAWHRYLELNADESARLKKSGQHITDRLEPLAAQRPG